MSEPVNVYEIAVEGHAGSPAGFRSRHRQLGTLLGAARLGATVWEIDPGEASAPYHFEGVEEEWLIVLEGRPTLRDPAGDHQLETGDVVCFGVGPGSAHQVRNRGDGVARLMMFSTVPDRDLSICVYPDSDKVSVWPWPGRRLRMAPNLDYWDGEA